MCYGEIPYLTPAVPSCGDMGAESAKLRKLKVEEMTPLSTNQVSKLRSNAPTADTNESRVPL